MSKKFLYGLVDTKLSEFVQVIMLDEVVFDDYWFSFANDISNPHYRRLKEFTVCKLAEFDTENGRIKPSYEFLGDCSQFLDKERQKLAIITQTLNFLPQGYFKMPKEMQEELNIQCKEAIKEYVQNFANVEQMKASVQNEN